MKKFKRFIIPTILTVLLTMVGGVWYVNSNATEKVVVEAPVVAQATGIPEDELYNLSVSGIIDETNKYRSSKGLTPLTENVLLDKSACLKADDMIAKDYWAHIAPDGTEPWYWIDQAGYKYKNAGENLIEGSANNKRIVDAWIKSPTHEANLSGEYTEIGVCTKDGIEYNGSKYTQLIVAHYGTQR